jgi:hypothetical protein
VGYLGGIHYEGSEDQVLQIDFEAGSRLAGRKEYRGVYVTYVEVSVFFFFFVLVVC